MTAHLIYLHVTWSTISRRPMIDEATRKFLDQYFRKIAVRERAEIVEMALPVDHVHLLLRCEARFDLPHLVQLLKGGSSYLASRQPDNVVGLRWNREYSLTSVSPGVLPRAIAYIRRQAARDRDPIGTR